MKNLLPISFGLLLLIGLAGCDTKPRMNYDSVDLVNVSGTVTLDEEPLPKAVVIFESEDGQMSYGLTDSNGNYSLQFDSEADGVTPGPKTVRISTTQKIIGLNTSDEDGGEETVEESDAESAAVERVPENYNRQSELKVVVEPTGSQKFDFDLTSQ